MAMYRCECTAAMSETETYGAINIVDCSRGHSETVRPIRPRSPISSPANWVYQPVPEWCLSFIEASFIIDIQLQNISHRKTPRLTRETREVKLILSRIQRLIYQRLGRCSILAPKVQAASSNPRLHRPTRPLSLPYVLWPFQWSNLMLKEPTACTHHHQPTRPGS